MTCEEREKCFNEVKEIASFKGLYTSNKRIEELENEIEYLLKNI